MTAEPRDNRSKVSRLLPCYLKPAEDGLMSNAIMLCEVIGEEIQSVSLRVAADAISRWMDGQELSPEGL